VLLYPGKLAGARAECAREVDRRLEIVDEHAMTSNPLLRKLERLGRRFALQRLGRRVYAIGIYAGSSPFELGPPPQVRNPVLTHHDVVDAQAFFVADPFIIQVDGAWHMFFEAMVWKNGRRIGVISHAQSRDGFAWEYDRVVLAEGFHLSYPYVFAWNSDFYMMPESRQAGAVRLYRADPFPHHWTYTGDLIRGPVLLDSSILRRDDRWWLFADTSPQLAHDTLKLFHARELTGPWTEHPRNPIVTGNRRTARPAGRIVSTPDLLVRFAQDCHPDYGRSVRAFRIDRLSESEYEETEHGAEPILGAGRERWNRGGMHHVDAHQLSPDRWIAAVDGWHRTFVRPREIALVAFGRLEAAPRGEQSE
jgi:hypothetical protein